MSLGAKLTVGLGFLFLILFALAIYRMFDIEGLYQDAEKIKRQLRFTGLL